MQKYQWKYWLIGLPILHFITFTLIKLYGEWLYAHQGIYYMVLIPNCAAAFLAGSLFAKEQLFNRFIFVLNKYSLQKNYLLMLGILGLVVIRTFLPVSFFNTYLALLFMLLFVSLRRSVNVDRILNYFGSHSTNMWLTHSFFCYYLFKDFVYGFKYPIVIYGALIFLSLGSSYIINAIMYLWSLVKENIKINILPTK